MKVTYWLPLAGYVIPTLGIGFGIVIPGSCIAGVNELTLGFLSAVAGAVLTYVMGIATVLHDVRGEPPSSPGAWLWRKIARQARQPAGLAGRILFAIMAKETRQDNDRAVSLLDVHTDHAVLEVGFGHGRTLQTLLQRAPLGRVSGVDWSADAVAKVRDRFT